jgi:hypothetical protein
LLYLILYFPVNWHRSRFAHFSKNFRSVCRITPYSRPFLRHPQNSPASTLALDVRQFSRLQSLVNLLSGTPLVPQLVVPMLINHCSSLRYVALYRRWRSQTALLVLPVERDVQCLAQLRVLEDEYFAGVGEQFGIGQLFVTFLGVTRRLCSGPPRRYNAAGI